MQKNSIVYGLTVIFSLLILYHTAILLGVSGNLYAWGSGVDENENIILLELFAIGVTLFCEYPCKSFCRQLVRESYWFRSCRSDNISVVEIEKKLSFFV
ncbi:MAG: hypothetical protein U9N39_04805 [Campylobacterota bacterium]|nr:hypothetical protein [Campylobacterota bacterium]